MRSSPTSRVRRFPSPANNVRKLTGRTATAKNHLVGNSYPVRRQPLASNVEVVLSYSTSLGDRLAAERLFKEVEP